MERLRCTTATDFLLYLHQNMSIMLNLPQFHRNFVGIFGVTIILDQRRCRTRTVIVHVTRPYMHFHCPYIMRPPIRGHYRQIISVFKSCSILCISSACIAQFSHSASSGRQTKGIQIDRNKPPVIWSKSRKTGSHGHQARQHSDTRNKSVHSQCWMDYERL